MHIKFKYILTLIGIIEKVLLIMLIFWLLSLMHVNLDDVVSNTELIFCIFAFTEIFRGAFLIIALFSYIMILNFISFTFGVLDVFISVVIDKDNSIIDIFLESCSYMKSNVLIFANFIDDWKLVPNNEEYWCMFNTFEYSGDIEHMTVTKYIDINKADETENKIDKDELNNESR